MARVVDTHRHYWGKGWDPPSRLRQLTLLYPGSKNPVEAKYAKDPDGSKMIGEMDYLGVDVAVLHTVDTGLAFMEETPTPIEEINKFHCELAKKYQGRIYTLFGIDPRRPGGLKLFEKAVKEWGAVGLSLWPIAGFYPNDPKCYPFYQKAIELEVPVTCHTGVQHEQGLLSKYGNPIYLDDVGADFPELTLVMSHTGMDKQPSTAWWEMAVCVASSKKNFYVEVADWQRVVRAMDDMPELFRKLKIMRDTCGAHRILFGTDQPSYNPDREKDDEELSRQWVELFKNLPVVAKQYGVNFNKEETELILHGNAERVFRIK